MEDVPPHCRPRPPPMHGAGALRGHLPPSPQKKVPKGKSCFVGIKPSPNLPTYIRTSKCSLFPNEWGRSGKTNGNYFRANAWFLPGVAGYSIILTDRDVPPVRLGFRRKRNLKPGMRFARKTVKPGSLVEMRKLTWPT